MNSGKKPRKDMRRQRLAKHEKCRLAKQITRPSEIAVYNLSVDLATRPDPVVVNVVTGLTLSAKILLICYRRALNELKCGFNGLRLIKLDFQKSWMHGHFGRLSTVKQLKITKRKSERERFRKQAHI